ASAPSVSRSASSIGPSNAAASTWPSSSLGLAWSRIAASTRRRSSASGSRMKYWSSASSLATSTASPWPPRPPPPPCSPSPHPPVRGQRGAGAGKPDRDHRVEQADVDPEFEGIGRRHSEQFALDEAPLDVAPLRGRVAGAVRRQPSLVAGAEPLEREPVDEL